MINTPDTHLNLARKWRSQRFDQIVGQDLSVRMLKNSLYLGHFFPVYLFSGQRGCGKTSTARVFAAAINCENLSKFQKDPRDAVLPCGTCSSCQAMVVGKHPDFIEIDAASHTGVDNVRQIIDSSSLMPLMGNKKIYLIDEAHMLSKAAFNAFLKILEEPPASVLFILATTEEHKILETVKSRCFQLLFKPIPLVALRNHLEHVCTKEEIRFERDGLELIINETAGSARDALNVLEQVRFARGMVTKQTVLESLGHIGDDRLITLAEHVLCKKPADLLVYVQKLQLSHFAADFVWHRFATLLHALVWLKYGVDPDEFAAHKDALQALANKCSLKQIQKLLQKLYDSEQIFSRTTAQHSFLEMILLRACQHNDGNDSGSAPVSQQAGSPGQPSTVEDEGCDEDDAEEDDDGQDQEDEQAGQPWHQFVRAIHALNDPLVTSVFSQGVFDSFDTDSGTLRVSFAKDLSFFTDWIDQTKKLWLPLLHTAFGQEVTFVPDFTRDKSVAPVRIAVPQSVPVATEKLVPKRAAQSQQQKSASPVLASRSAAQQQRSGGYRNSYRNSRQVSVYCAAPRVKIDTSDMATWQQTHRLLSHFPGSVAEIQEHVQ